MDTAGLLSLLVTAIVIGSSIWVLCDARLIGVQKGQVEGLANMGPWGWFFACLFLWIVGFPWYWAKRPAFLRANGREPSLQASGLGYGLYAVQIALIIVMVMSNPKVGIDELQAQVQADIARSFASKPQLAGVTVQALQLVHQTGNQYRGLLKVSAAGENSELGVDVTYDGRQFMWQVDQ
jgi:hypothetical protein